MEEEEASSIKDISVLKASIFASRKLNDFLFRLARNEISPFFDFNVTSFVYFPEQMEDIFLLCARPARLPFSLSAPESNA